MQAPNNWAPNKTFWPPSEQSASNETYETRLHFCIDPTTLYIDWPLGYSNYGKRQRYMKQLMQD